MNMVEHLMLRRVYVGDWFGEIGKRRRILANCVGKELGMVEILPRIDNFCLQGADRRVVWSISLEARRLEERLNA